MNEEDHQFLMLIRNYVYKKPEVAAFVAQYAAYGLEDALNKSREQCSNLETALYAALSRRYKFTEKVTIDRIKDFVKLGINYIRWDSFIEEYEKSQGEKK